MNKEIILEKAKRFPNAFCLLPILDGKPDQPGTWGAYPLDNVMLLWINSQHEEAIIYYQQTIQNEKELEMSKELTVQEKSNVQVLLSNNFKAIKSVLPKHLTPERALRIAFTSIAMNPTLARCSQISLLNCVIEASMIGLEIGGPLSHCCLLPFKNNKTKGHEAQLVIEYAGKMELAFRSGFVKSFSNHAVFANDEFRYEYGLNPDLKHRPCDTGERGELVYAYAIAHFKTGGHDFEVVNRKVAMEAKAKSSGARFQGSSSPWSQKENEPAMWVKTALHRLSKRLPKSPEIQSIFDKIETESSQDFGHVIDVDVQEPDFLPPEPEKITDNSNQQSSQTPPKNNQPQENKQQPLLRTAPPTTEELKFMNQYKQVAENFPGEFEEACSSLNISKGTADPVEMQQIYNKMLSGMEG